VGRTERLYKIQRLLTEKQFVTAAQFLSLLEVSRATFRRDLDYLRDRLGAPISWDAEAGGYVMQTKPGTEAPQVLPGMWLNEKELFSLLSVIQMLSGLEPDGLIGIQIKPIRERLEMLLEQGAYTASEIRRRICLIPLGKRQTSSQHFQAIGQALLQRKRLQLRHFGRMDAKVTEREVSPQRLVYYRDNWYLDAFCHLRDDVRSFAIDAIEDALEIDKEAVSVEEKTLQKNLDATYGIFSGKSLKIAKLRFSPFRARWVAKEVWHPDQKGAMQEDGSYVLEVPYADDRELMHDILRQGREVEVLEPVELRNKLREELEEMHNNIFKTLVISKKN
jgi:predicted DNA-binding transcriptional regulator YafY